MAWKNLSPILARLEATLKVRLKKSDDGKHQTGLTIYNTAEYTCQMQ